MTILKRTFIVLISFIVLAGCGMNANQENHNDALNIGASEYGDLPSSIGDSTHADSLPVLEMENSQLWELTEYEQQTGEWFLMEDGGEIGFSMTSGIKLPGSEVMISLQPHPEQEVELIRQVRAQLTKRDSNLQKLELLEEVLLDIQDVAPKEKILSTQLPDEEGVKYLLSVEILDENQQPEDTLLTLIQVPEQEMNLRMYTDKNQYERGDQVTLSIENYGPTSLSFGKDYTIEKKINGQWSQVQLDREVNSIGIELRPEQEPYSETIQLEQLDEGEYRIIKTFHAAGTDLQEVLAASFHIK